MNSHTLTRLFIFLSLFLFAMGAGHASEHVIHGPVLASGDTFSVSQPDKVTWTVVGFEEKFSAAPVVIPSVLTSNDADPAEVMLSDVTSDGVDVQVGEWEYQDGLHGDESVGLLLLEPGLHVLGGLSAEAGTATVSGGFTRVDFAAAFSAKPVVLAQLVSEKGDVTATVRLRNVDTGGFSALLQTEEALGTVGDVRTLHYLAIEEGSGDYEGQRLLVGRTGRVVSHAVRDVLFGEELESPVFYAQDQHRFGGDTSWVRLAGLYADRAEIFIQEEQSADAEVAHTTEDVGWVVLGGTVAEPVDTPIALDDSVSTLEGVEVQIAVLANDTGDFDVSTVDTNVAPVAELGYLSLNESTGVLTYNPYAGSTGTDTFGYRVSNSAGVRSNIAVVTVTINPDNSPIALNDTVSTTEGSQVQIPVLANDTGDLDPSTVDTNVSPVAELGFLSLDEITGVLTYTPYAGSTGTDTFGYRVSDGSGLYSNNAVVTVTIIAESPEFPVITGPVLASGDTFLVSQPDKVTWTVVGFEEKFSAAPVVIPSVLTSNDADPAEVMLSDVTSDGVDVQVGEWEYQDGLHGDESVGLLLLEPGLHDLGGLSAEAGTATVSGGFTRVDFAAAFSAKPVVLAQLVSEKGDVTATVRLRNVDTGGFSALLQTEEALGTVGDVRTLHYLAIEEGSGDYEGQRLLVGRTGRVVSHAVRDVLFGEELESPVFYAQDQQRYGGDTSWVRLAGLYADRAEIFIQEEQSANAEVAHTTEDVGWVVLGGTIAEPVDTPIALDDSVSTLEGVEVQIAVLANDTGDFDVSTVDTNVAPTAELGYLSLNESTGVLTYNPYAGSTGTDTFGYRVSNSAGVRSNIAVVTVTINPDNSPIALNDSVSTTEGSQVQIPVLANDTGDLDPSTVDTNVSPVAELGFLSLDEITGVLTYTPYAGSTGTDTFGYRVSDGSGLYSNNAVVTVTIIAESPEFPVITGPVLASGDTFLVSQPDKVTWTVVGFEEKFSAAPVVIPSVLTSNDADPAEVMLSDVTSDGVDVQVGEWEYQDGLHGDESVGLLLLEPGLHDLGGLSAEAGTATVNGGFTRVDFAAAFSAKPVVLAQLVSEKGDVTATVRLRNVDTGGFSALLQTEEALGTVGDVRTLHYLAIEEGSGDYEGQRLLVGRTGRVVSHAVRDVLFGEELESPVFYAQDQQRYGGDTSWVRLAGLYADRAEIFIQEEQSANAEVAHTTEDVGWVVLGGTVAEPVDTPIALDDSVSTLEGVEVQIAVLANDTGDFDVSTVDTNVAPAAELGYLSLNESTGVLTYTPYAGSTGTDTFGYRVSNSAGVRSNVAVVTVAITPMADPNVLPLAVNDTVLVQTGDSVTVSVLTNDEDSDGTLVPNTVEVVTGASEGLAEAQANGTIVYTPDPATTATSDTFTYLVKDDDGADSNVATVTVTITPIPNMPPLAANDTVSVQVGNSATVSVLTNDEDNDGTLVPSTVEVVTAASEGLAEALPNGTIIYTPNPATTATSDTFTYLVKDDDGANSNVAIVTVTITPIPNVPPIAANDTVSVELGDSATVSVLTNDEDSDGTLVPNTVEVVTAASEGLAEAQPNGTIIYTPDPATTATSDSFTYLVKDDDGADSNVATVTVTITPIPNFPPIAANDTVSVQLLDRATVSVLTNDEDIDGTLVPSTVEVVTGPSEGQAEAQPNGTIVYTPNPATIATSDSFTYLVKDDDGADSNVATVTVTITPIPNVPPIAANDAVTVQIGDSATVSVLTNDEDSDGTLVPNTVEVVTGPSDGQAEAQTNGTIVYTPDPETTATSDSFTYLVKDDDGADSNVAIVTVTITPIPNMPPLAANDTVSVELGDRATVSVLTNDEDSDGTLVPNTVEVVTGPSEGQAEAQPNGTIVYTPNPATTATSDSFNYLVKDDDGADSNVATVTVTITPIPNVPPIAANDAVSVELGDSATVSVLTNDEDSDGTLIPNSVEVVTGASEGQAEAQPNGTIVYTPNPATTATSDTFTYLVKDDDGADSNIATVTVTITPIPNVPPIAANDSVSVQLGESATVSVLTNDEDSDGILVPNTVEVVTFASEGLAEAQANGTIVYTPDPATTVTSDTFTYLVKDDDGADSNVATVTVTITPIPNVPPIAVNDTVSVQIGESATVSVLTNDEDSDGTLVPNTVELVTVASEGLAEAQPNGTIIYTPDPATTATSDTFSYLVKDDDDADSNIATVTVTINPIPNIAPVAVDDNVDVIEGDPANINVLSNDVDTDGSIDVDSVVITQQATNGSAVPQADGTVLYTRTNTAATLDSFTYTVSDDLGLASNEATVTITIISDQNVAPVAGDDSFIVTIGQPEALGVLVNDSDPDGSINIASITIVQQPVNGSALAQNDGTILFTPGATPSTETFTYRVDDNEGVTSNIATVVVSVVNNSSLFAEHRNGQTFLTWDETSPTDGYHVYRASAPITQANLGAATRLTDRWGALDNNTSINTHGGPNVPANFVIDDLGAALSNDQGLFVYTTQNGEGGTAYYAITSVNNGVEDVSSLQTSEAVAESVSTPRDVLTVSVNGGKGRIYTQYMDYSNWNPTFNGYAYNYSVAVPSNYNPAQSYPLVIEAHAYFEIFKFETETEFDWQVIQLFPHDPGPPVGALHSWWYGYAADHNYLNGGIPSSGTIENFTEQRVMRSVDELITNNFFNIDEQRIHAFGNSMGASGVTSWGMRYPSLISGIYASQPMMNYETSPTFEGELRQAWGSTASNLPIVNGGPHDEDINFYGEDGVVSVGVWDWMNHHQQLDDRRGDEFAYLMISHGKGDTTIDWATQGRPTVQALTDANVGFSAVANTVGHTWGAFDAVVTSMFGLGFGTEFPWKYPLDQSFPAIQNASGSGPIDPANFGIDNYNLNIEWATPQNPFDDVIVDLPSQYEITLRSTGAAQTADITPRRTQRFDPEVGQQCSWTATDNNTGQALGAGNSTVDIDSLITIPAVNITIGVGTRLVIDC